ncbi:MAG: hypothetical protein ACI97P_000162 [Arcticibacterium sp.]|jgi:hypothetical protein
MKQYVFKEGDLELLALGVFPGNDEEALIREIRKNPDLLVEFEAIQNALIGSALENGVQVPHGSKPSLPGLEKEKAFKSVFRNNWLRIAAATLLAGSMLGNFYLFSSDEVLSGNVVTERNSEFLTTIPFEVSVFEDLFVYLENELKENPCEMSYEATKAFLKVRGLDTPENLEFLGNHEGHCDCEVLMNISEFFPHERYKHGQILLESHRDANIKQVYIQTYTRGPLIAIR